MILKFFLLKELKKYPLFFILLSITLFLGTIGIISIGIVSDQVGAKLRSSANELLTSDLSVSARRELFPNELAILKKTFLQRSVETYKIIDIYSMVTHQSKGSRLVEIRATEKGFPFYGKIKLKTGEFNHGSMYISRDLADLWSIEDGEMLQMGERFLKVSGIVESDTSQGLRGFSLAPRVYVPLSELEKTGLIKPGATGSFAHHFKLQSTERDKAKEIKKEIYDSIKDSAVKVTLPEDSSEQTGRAINTITNFMALSSLIGLILSLVGVFYLYQSHLLARLKDFCLLNLHGLSKSQIIVGIIVQFCFVFCFIVFLELISIIPLYRAFVPYLSQNLGMDLTSTVNFLGVVSTIPLLFLISLTILIPLLLGLMRTSMGLQLKAQKLSLGRFRFYDFIPFLVILWFSSCFLVKSLKIGSLFFFALLIIFLVSSLFIKSAQWFLSKFINKNGLLNPTIETGIALRSLTRSGHKLTLSFLSLVIGTTLISLILQLDKMILSEFTLDTKKPSLFIFDVQEDQLEPLMKVADENQTPLNFITPMIRARFEKINDEKFIRQKRDYNFRDEDELSRMRSNSINLTYRGYLTDAERIIDGFPFPPGGAPEDRLPYLSIEKRWAERMGVKLGDKLTFDVQGVEFQAVVYNIKEVKWTSFYPNFFVTVEPSFIESAPKTFLAILPSSPKNLKLSFQQKAVNQFSNISFIDVEDLIQKVTSMFDKSRKSIEIISWLSLFVGLVILYGLSHDQVYRRYYDIALLKTMGLSTLSLRLNLLTEFGIVFLSAELIGLFLGWLMAVIIGKEVFKISLSIDWERMVYPGAILTILCLATILLSSWRAVRSKPRELLSDT